MTIEIEFIIFIILSVAHPIGDFGTPYRRWGIKSYKELKTKKGWEMFLLSEWILVISPFHWLWDAYSSWRKHPNHASPYYCIDLDYPKWTAEMGTKGAVEIAPGKYKQTFEGWTYYDQCGNIIPQEKIDSYNWDNPIGQQIGNGFWRHLCIDQLFHTVSNILLALFIGAIL